MSTHFLIVRGGLKFIFFGISIFSYTFCFAQKENPSGAVSNGLAGSVCAIADASHGLQAPATYAFAQERVLYMDIKNHYLLPTLFTSAIQGIFPLKNKMNAVISAQRFGPEHYKELRISGTMAHKIGHTALACRLNWEELAIEGFSTQHAFTLEFGGITKLQEHLSFGANLYNITLSKFSNYPLPVILKCGLNVLCTKTFSFSGELEKNSQQSTLIKWGMQYQITPSILLLAGFKHPTSSLHGGISIRRDSLFSVSYSISWQFQLGLTQELTLSYGLKKQSAF